MAVCYCDAPQHGLLVNLRDICMLFEPEINGSGQLHDDWLEHRTTYKAFPQAFLSSVGHFQAQGLVYSFNSIM
jgi:hypothetical protein